MIKGKNYEISKENIFAHELIGLKTKIIGGTEKSRTGMKGYIVDETKNLIILETDIGTKKIPKSESVFEIELGKEKATINGKRIVARPEDRIKLAWRKRT